MKLHLPKTLRVALLAALAFVAQPAMASVTYDNLTGIIKDTDNNVYYNGQGTFYVNSDKTTTMQVTIDLGNLKSYQHSNDYATVCNGASTFVTWSYNNDNSWGLADYWKNPQQDLDYANYGSEARLTGYWNGTTWNAETAASGGNTYYATYDTLSQYATDGKLTMTITNNPVKGGGIQATCQDANGNTVTLYNGTGLLDSTVGSTKSYSVNLNYVTAVTLTTDSTLDVSTFKEPVDYSKPYVSERWDAGEASSLGRVLFAGDSITHGVQDMTWRWQMFKTFQDNGIENEIAGPREGFDSTPNTSDYRGTTTTYGGVEFNNAHLAQSSGRTHNIVTGGTALGGRNYGGWSTAKTAAAYDADTIVCLMGTNDILSDGGSNTSDYCTKFARMLGGVVSYENGKYVWSQQGEAANDYDSWGTFGKMVGDLSNQERDTVYIMSVPCWTSHANSNAESYHQAGMQFNTLLEDWTKQYGTAQNKNVVYVDVNKGLIDPSAPTSFFGNASFFRDPGTASGKDGLHPNEQGSLIIAGNLARGMGLAGRTAGLNRSAANATGWTSFTEASVSLSSGETRQLLHDVFTQDGGYTIDFSAVFGNGAEDGWLDGEKAVNVAASNALSITIGDGANSGTLNLAEGYIMWGNSVLYCQDNSLSSNESLRIAYHNGNTEDNVASGYYVWLGDMLIGQGLGNQTGTAINGVVLSATGATGTLSNLSYRNTAYAPTTTLTVGANPYAVTQTAGNTELIHTPELDVLPALGNHDNAEKVTDKVNWKTAASGSAMYASSTTADANGNKSYVTTLGSAAGSWVAAINGGSGYTGDLNLKVGEGSKGFKTAFGAVNTGTVDGNVTVVLDSADATVESFTSTNAASIVGGYSDKNSNTCITGTFTAIVNAGTLQKDIIGGFHTANVGNHIGAVDLVLNGGSVNGSIYGGSIAANGTVDNGIKITVTGGHVTGNIVGSGTAGTVNGDIAITVTGGIIDGDITAKQSSGVTYASGKTGTVTVEGNLAKIGGSITADTVTLKDVAQSEYSDTFDKYAGTISAAKVVLDNYTADELQATLAGSVTVSATNGTSTAFSKSTTIDTLQLEEGTKLGFKADSTLSNANQNTNGTVLVNGATLMLGKEQEVSNTKQTYNRVEINDAVLKSGAKGDNNVRNISTLAVAGASRLEQFSWHTLWNIGSLTDVEGADPGTLTWQMDCNHYNTSIMKLTEEGDFSGKLVVARNCPKTSNGTYQAYLQVDNTKALQNATVELKGTKANDIVAMALNNAAVTIGGLEGTANSIVYAGEAKTKPGNAAPVSTDASVLTINTAGDHTYAGTIAAGVSLALKGSGTQTLSGNTTLGGVSVANGTTLNYEGGTHAITEQSATSAVSNMVVKKGASVELSGSSTITNLSVNNSSMTFNGGKHTITNLDANDENVAAGSVTIQDGAEVAVSGRLRIGAKGETYTIQGGGSLALTGQNVKIEAASNDVAATLNSTNTANSGYYTYNSGDNYSENFKIENAKVTLSGTKNIKNKLVNSSVVADTDAADGVSVSNSNNTLTALTAQKGNLKVSHTAASAGTLKSVAATGGNIDLLNATEDVALTNLEIGSGYSVSALKDGATLAADESNVGNISVSGTMKAAEGTLNANLTLKRGAALQSTGVLTMGCAVTLEGGTNITVDGDVTAGPVYLFTGVDSLTLGNASINNATWTDAAGYVINGVTASAGEYVIGYWDGAVSIAASNVPEPATATLSLLALAALAARRRR